MAGLIDWIVNMRGFKFRVWIKQFKKMSNLIEFYCDGGALAGDYEYPLDKDDIEVMQFLGLKDKNGVDICEGDIVKCSYRGVCWIDGVEVVEYSPEYGFSPIQEPVDYGDVHAESWHWEVVGNKYENPELLE